MYGRDAILPIQLTKKPSEKFSSEPQLQVQGLEGCDTEQTNKEGLQNRTDEIKRISQIVIPQAIKFINVAQTRQKCNYDKRCTPAEYCEGDLVLKKNMKNVARAGGKQEKKWLGPYIVIERFDKGVYLLMDMKGKMLAKQVNSKQLKFYNERKVVKKIDKLELNIGNEKEHTAAVQLILTINLEDTKNSSTCSSTLPHDDNHQMQLYSTHLLRLWRTGAAMLGYSAKEDEDFDASYTV